jgi:PleD family two-component response regulator
VLFQTYVIVVIAITLLQYTKQLLSHLDGRSSYHQQQQHQFAAAQSKTQSSSSQQYGADSRSESKLDSKYDDSSSSSNYDYSQQQQQQQQQQQALQRDNSSRSTTTAAEFKSDSPTPSKTSTKDRVSILVVDDSNISSKLAVRKLAALGHDTVHAENGQVALDILRAPGGHNVSVTYSNYRSICVTSMRYR